MRLHPTSPFKRIASFLLALVMVLGLLPVSPHAHAAEGEGYTITFYKKNVRQNGDHVTFKYTEVDNPAGGEKVTLKIVPDGDAADSWFAIYSGLHDLKTDYADMTPLLNYSVASKVGGFSSNWPDKGGISFEKGDYSLVVFDDSTTDYPAMYITFTVNREVVSSQLITDATCTQNGIIHEVYADGGEADVSIPAYGHLVDAFTEVDGTDTHSAVCDRSDCRETVVEDCTFGSGYTCTVCESTKEFYTDKTEYKYGEPIKVFSGYHGSGSWVGLYKSSDPTDGSVTSLFWIDTPADGVSADLLKGEQQRPSEYIAGDYKVVLFADGGYTNKAVLNITITTEIDESKTVTVRPTCDKDGTATYYNTDGTVAKVETLPSSGHDYETLKPEYNKDNGQHTLVCNNDANHRIVENCSWDKGTVTREPTDGENGEMTYTCTVCNGTRTESISNKTVDREEVTKNPTCEEDGEKTVYYTDGTSEKLPIPKLNHAYPEKFTYNNDQKTHSKVCANDAAHVETGDCTFESSAVSGGTRYTCSVCGGYYDVIILSTNKTEYALGEPILVSVDNSVYDETANDWIGIWERNLSHTDDISIYYYYPASEGWTDFNIENSSVHQQPNTQSYTLGVGTYTIRMYTEKNGDWYVPITSVTITIGPAVRDESKTVRVEPTCETDGSITYYLTNGQVEKVVTAAEDETLKASGHSWSKWTQVENTETHSRTCENDPTHTETKNCEWDEGTVTKEPTAEESGVMTYTCTVCDGKRTEPIISKTVDHEEITKEPTCEEAGQKTVYYTDGTSEVLPVPKLNHAYPETYTYNNDQKTHSRVCANDKNHVQTGDCSFTSSTVSGGKRYTCSVCGGHYDELVLSTDKTEYAMGEKIMVTTTTGGSGWWIGIYKKGESTGSDVSIWWMDTPCADTYDILSGIPATDRPLSDYVANETYTIYLFSTYSYDICTSVDVHVGPAVRDESKTVRVEPTCETDGSITYYLTNGEVEKVITAAEDETLKAIGHSWNKWTQVENTETHTRSCANDPAHVETNDCVWDEGTETKAPTTEEAGEMTYTCTVCEGTKVESIPKLNAVETGREVIAPTCLEGGYTLVTYSDGSTKKIDPTSKLGHDFGDYKHIEGTHTHTQTCQRTDCGVSETVPCDLETNGVLSGNYYAYACTKCGEWREYVILTDKAVYASGEDIIITIHPNYAATMNSKDWIGLYKKGEAPNSDKNPTSIRWSYVGDFVNGMNIFNSSNHDRPLEDPNNYLVAGEYLLYLCANDGYSQVAKVSITVTTELDESKTVRTEPTCTEDGKITYYNTDGTVNKVVTAEEDETLKATGHNYGQWVFDGVEKQTHTHTCTCSHTETKPCEWDNGVVTLEPTYEEDGIKTYTCGVCSGEKTEVLPKLSVTVTGTETKDPTCDDAGYIRTFYSDGTHSDEVLPAKGHAYGDWTVVEGTKTHAKICANDASHVITEDCAITSTVDGNKVTHVCSVCKHSYTTGLLETDKLVYGVTDPIMVTVHSTYPGAWVGLYKEGELFDPNNGGVASLFWTYVTEDMIGKPFDLTAVTASTTSGLRGEKLSNGKYVLCFFRDSGYTDVVDSVELEVFTDMSGTEFEMLFYKGAVRENGYHKRFQLKEVDHPEQGEKVTLGVNVKTGEIGSSWVGVFDGKYDLDTNFEGMAPIVKKYISDIDGKTPFSLNWKSKGGFDFYVGNFTVVIFADAGYSYPVKYVTFEVYRPTVSEEIMREPTCDTPGVKYVVYVDDGNDETEDEAFVDIPALGHEYSEWNCVEGTNTHSRTCSRETCGNVEFQDCSFENEKCSICGGKEYHIHELTKVDAKESTCTTTGNIAYYTCDCGKWFADEKATEEITDKNAVVTEMKAHSWTPATCTNPKTCSVCKATEGKELGHTWTEASCIAPKSCSVCHATEGEALPHTWIAATCTTPKICSVCNATEGNALGHAYGVWTYDEATKSHNKVCTNDNTHVLNEKCTFGDPEVIKQPVGNNAGTKKYTCSVCSGSYTEEFTNAPAAGSFDRYYGADRYQTAFAVADQLKKNLGIEKFSAIVVACGTNFADALSGNYLANQKNAPILLVKNQNIDTVKAYIKNNLAPGGTLYILGGPQAVPASMETGLDGFSVKRLGGATRYETNILILKEAGVKSGDDLLVCTGKDFADCLSASAVNKPVLLVKDALDASQQTYLNSINRGSLYIIGGNAAVNEKLESALAQYRSTERISGATRYETSVNIARKFFPDTKCAVLVYGMDFPDGLCGGALANSMNAPVVLVTNVKQAAAVDYAKSSGIQHGVVLGGSKLISDAVATSIFMQAK